MVKGDKSSKYQSDDFMHYATYHCLDTEQLNSCVTNMDCSIDYQMVLLWQCYIHNFFMVTM